MVIRKPYAFLIKYFKLIHIILFIFMSYLVYKTNAIYVFFKDYAKTGTYTYINNMAFSYVNIFMIIIAIILVALLLLIYFLMKKKEKKVLFYLLATIYYFISFILYIYFISIFNSLEFTVYNNQSLVLFRDISMVLYYLNYIFLAVSFVRGFGFNIKKFNFDKDIKELDISDEDREEIEVGGIVDYENVGDFLRRRKRNFGYYIKENSYILIVFLVITILSLGSYIAINKLVTNKLFSYGENINIGNFHYIINNGYIINKDLNDEEIKKNKSYFIIDFNINNQSQNNYLVDLSKTRLKIDNEYYYPKNNLDSIFNEFGEIYKKQVLKPDINNNYILVFETNKLNNPNNIRLELLNGSKVVNNEVVFNYKEVNIIPYSFNNISLGEYKLNEEIDLSKTLYTKGKFVVKSVEIVDNVNYTYNKCVSDTKCYDYDKVISPSGNNKILKIEYSLDINKNIFNYLKINNKTVNDITPSSYNDNERLLEIPNELVDNYELIFDVRGTSFKIIK